MAIEGHVGHAVVVQVAIDGDVLVDQQLRSELNGHARTERDDVAVLRRSQRRAQRADTRVEVVGRRPGGQAPLVLAHGFARQHVGAFDGAGGDLQIPVAADTGAIVRSSHVTPGQLRQRVDETQAAITFSGVAAVNQDVATGVHVLADFRKNRAALGDVVCREITVAQPQITGIAVGNDLHRADAVMLIKEVGDLLQTILAGVEFHHLRAGRNALEQAVGVLHPRIDEHHTLAGHRDRAGRRRGISLAVGVFARYGMIGCRRLGRIGSGGCMAVGLRSGIGHGGGHRAVEQHARLQRHDHRRGQRTLTCGCPRPDFCTAKNAPPHVAHPNSNEGT
ncbi:hypothetical protein D3C87_995130 [compost metagenome]